MTQNFTNGSMVRVTKGHEGPEGWIYADTKFIVDFFVPEETLYEGTEGEVTIEDSYVGHAVAGFDTHEALAEFVELYKTPEEAKKVGPPSREEVAAAVSEAVMGIWGEHGFSVHEGDSPHPDGTDFGATTDDGVEFNFQVKINWVETAW